MNILTADLQWFQLILTVIGSVIASSGFWAFLQKRNDRKDVKTQMLIGLGHDRIMYLGMKYIERTDADGKNYITDIEYENFYKYLYSPYIKLGGNGSAVRIMKEVDKLPIRKEKWNNIPILYNVQYNKEEGDSYEL